MKRFTDTSHSSCELSKQTKAFTYSPDRKPKPPQEFAATTLHSMPRVFLLFLLHLPLSAYLQHSVIFNLNLHLLFVEPRKISLEHMGFWGLLPIHASVNQGRSFFCKTEIQMRTGNP
ncbi:hypothetical protein CFP56_003412 [Quercus suber]|uniref:Uncharacterized protein n=1 Tax=Quercus suber TaxID=58331 RepID=A0AAW0LD23_QUESU